MLHIAICDQSYSNRQQTADILMKILFDETEIRFVFYESGMQVIDDIINQKFRADLMFIDVLLPKVNGIKTVEFLREQNIKTDIIFLTEAAEYATDGYRYHAFDYLIKPVSPTRFEQTMQRYIEEVLYTPEDFLDVQIKGCGYKIQLQRVLFFESSERKISAVMADEEVMFYQKMNDLQEILGETSFIRCHQSYIVNKAYIMRVAASDITLVNGKKIPVSKRYSKSVRENLLSLK